MQRLLTPPSAETLPRHAANCAAAATAGRQAAAAPVATATSTSTALAFAVGFCPGACASARSARCAVSHSLSPLFYSLPASAHSSLSPPASPSLNLQHRLCPGDSRNRRFADVGAPPWGVYRGQGVWQGGRRGSRVAACLFQQTRKDLRSLG